MGLRRFRVSGGRSLSIIGSVDAEAGKWRTGGAPPTAVIPGRSEAEGKGIQRRFNGLRGRWIPFPALTRRRG